MKDQSDENVPQTPPAPAPQPWGEQQPAKPAQVQYVVAKQSLEGLGGWLIFWMVFFALLGLTYIGVFFSALGAGISTSQEMLITLFSPIMAVAFIASVALIAMRKKLGKTVSIAALVIIELYSVISSAMGIANNSSSVNVSSTISSMVVSIVITGLFILYFLVSKRVKATLVG